MDDLDLIRSKIDIVELVGSYITLKKAGRNFKALCPFHSEKTPSFIVSAERQIFKCFGCQAGGDVFGFLMNFEKMTFVEALRFLADKAGVKLKSYQATGAQKEKEKLLSINHLAQEFYHYILLSHPVGKRGLSYLLQRGIGPSSIKLFKLGYAPENWRTLLDYLNKKKGYLSQDLEKIGLVIKKSLTTNHYSPRLHQGFGGQAITNYYDRFRGRIIFPLTDHRNNILGFSGRTLKQDENEAKYINSPETELYHKSELLYGLFQTKDFIKKEKRAVVVEGELDVISSFQAGIKNIVAIKGSALTENQVNLIKRFSNNLVLSLDKDTAGDAAVRRGIEIADAAGLNIRVTQPKYGKDPDECARHSPVLWRESVKEAIPVYDFYLASAVSRYNPKTAEGKKQISEELIPVLASITNEVIKAHYLKKLAEMLEVEEDIINKEIVRWEKQQKIDQPAVPFAFKQENKIPLETRRAVLEELLLSFILQQEDKTKDLVKDIDPDIINQPVIKKIISLLIKFLEKNQFNINNFAKTLPQELQAILDKAYLMDIQDILKDPHKSKREFIKTKNVIIRIALKTKLSLLAQDMREKEKSGEVEKGDRLRSQFSQLSKQLKDLS